MFNNLILEYRDVLILLARVLLMVLFLVTGWKKLTNFSATSAYMASTGAAVYRLYLDDGTDGPSFLGGYGCRSRRPGNQFLQEHQHHGRVAAASGHGAGKVRFTPVENMATALCEWSCRRVRTLRAAI